MTEFYKVSMGSFEKLAFGLHILGNQHGGPFSDYFTEVNICSFCSLWECDNCNTITCCWEQRKQGKEASFQLCTESHRRSSLSWWRQEMQRETQCPAIVQCIQATAPCGWDFSFWQGHGAVYELSYELFSLPTFWEAVLCRSKNSEALLLSILQTP